MSEIDLGGFVAEVCPDDEYGEGVHFDTDTANFLTCQEMDALCAWWAEQREQQAIEAHKAGRSLNDLDRRLRYLEMHLLCGKGIFGCNGGKDCQWDHK